MMVDVRVAVFLGALLINLVYHLWRCHRRDNQTLLVLLITQALASLIIAFLLPPPQNGLIWLAGLFITRIVDSASWYALRVVWGWNSPYKSRLDTLEASIR